MIENEYIRFNDRIWGFDFICHRCGAGGQSEGDAPIAAMDAMREKSWDFETQGEKALPLCPACSSSPP